MNRDELMKRAEGAVDAAVRCALAKDGLGEIAARKNFTAAIRACLDWSPGCEGCRWNLTPLPDDGRICYPCRRYPHLDNYARLGGEDDDE